MGFSLSESQTELADTHQRRFAYLRLSVTDRCNFRCSYCLPNGYEALADAPSELSIDEIRRLVRGFAFLGVEKVRLTGGEPTVRRDIVEIASAVSSVPGIRRVALTTNGYRLAELAPALRQAGVRSVNISIDSLDESRFREITGTARFREVIAGLDAAIEHGFESIKINAVLLRNGNSDELPMFMQWVKGRAVSVRFIELMQTGRNGEYFSQRHLSAGEIRLELLKAGWTIRDRSRTDGPAVVFGHPDYRGTIGIIAPYSQDFCVSCNRLRVTSRGALKLCLFGERDLPLRDLLQEGVDVERLASRVRALVLEKPAAHRLHEGNYGNTWNFAGIGG